MYNTDMKKYMLIILCLILAVIALLLFLNYRGRGDASQPFRTELGNAKISAVSIDIGKADLTVTVGGKGPVSIESAGITVASECTDGVLSVRTVSEATSRKAFVNISLPEGTATDTCSISLGVGSLTVRDLPFREGTFNCGVGDSSLAFAAVPEKLEIRSGSGDVSAVFPGTDEIRIRAPFGLGGRDYAERFIVDDTADILIDVSLGNTTLR